METILLSVLSLLTTLRFHPPALPGVLTVYWADIAMLGVVAVYIGIAITGPPIEGLYDNVKESLGLTVVGGALVVLGVGIGAVLGEGYPLAALGNIGRILYYIVLLLAAYLLCRRKRTSTKFLYRTFIAGLYVNFAVAVVQLLDPGLLGEVIRGLYGTDKLRSLETGYPRVYGCFYNANWFAAYLVFMGAAVLSKVENAGGWNYWSFVHLALIVAAMAFSGSRAGFVGLLLVIGAFLITTNIHQTTKTIVFLGGGLVIVVAVVEPASLVTVLGRTANRFMSFSELASGNVSLSAITALEARIESWRRAITLFVEEPVFGYGDSGVGHNFIPHNSYLTLLLSGGLVGGIGAGTAVSGIAVAMYRASRYINSIWSARWLFLSSVGISVMSFAADYVFTSQVVALGLLLTATVIADLERG